MSGTKICRYCGQVIDSKAEVCKYCKKNLMKEHDNPDLFCKRCKAPVNTDDNFCQKCGAIFNIPETPVPLEHNMYGIRYNIGIFLTSLAASFAITILYNSGKETTVVGNSITFCVAFIIAEIFLYIYFLPSILAFERNNPNAYFIYVCNLLFGVTVIGWIISLVFALKSD
jgi:RNA polymerase subunit RPABC4/transcription elongation factor Spt4